MKTSQVMIYTREQKLKVHTFDDKDTTRMHLFELSCSGNMFECTFSYSYSCSGCVIFLNIDVSCSFVSFC